MKARRGGPGPRTVARRFRRGLGLVVSTAVVRAPVGMAVAPSVMVIVGIVKVVLMASLQGADLRDQLRSVDQGDLMVS